MSTPDAHEDHPAADWRALVDGFAADIWAIARALAADPADVLAAWELTWLRLAEVFVDSGERQPHPFQPWQVRARETALEESVRAILTRRWNDTAKPGRPTDLS